MTRPAEPAQQSPHNDAHDRTGLLQSGAATLIGAMALAVSVLYVLSDVIEVAQGGFSTGQLRLTLVALAQGLPDSVHLGAAGVRALGFASMGVAQLRTRRR